MSSGNVQTLGENLAILETLRSLNSRFKGGYFAVDAVARAAKQPVCDQFYNELIALRDRGVIQTTGNWLRPEAVVVISQIKISVDTTG